MEDITLVGGRGEGGIVLRRRQRPKKTMAIRGWPNSDSLQSFPQNNIKSGMSTYDPVWKFDR